MLFAFWKSAFEILRGFGQGGLGVLFPPRSILMRRCRWRSLVFSSPSMILVTVDDLFFASLYLRSERCRSRFAIYWRLVHRGPFQRNSFLWCVLVSAASDVKQTSNPSSRPYSKLLAWSLTRITSDYHVSAHTHTRPLARLGRQPQAARDLLLRC